MQTAKPVDPLATVLLNLSSTTSVTLTNKVISLFLTNSIGHIYPEKYASMNKSLPPPPAKKPAARKSSSSLSKNKKSGVKPLSRPPFKLMSARPVRLGTPIHKNPIQKKRAVANHTTLPLRKPTTNGTVPAKLSTPHTMAQLDLLLKLPGFKLQNERRRSFQANSA
ncbi:hypothetical protein FisN_18Lh288 [Fistulifera solaris]|uniref:Uncharacterized protein n=1 Tax=Fistulifera solaris TaxID=1519565 RepID=A0A1Z5JUW6_FISSO|nr:hypothetical protein FisN_18Lh288 [Fistulifera solaris]|eukprot:GAX17632.1 hypothetical protein FisN_18Lh288 [Fistulifera solaris]